MSYRTMKAKLKKRANKLANLAWDAIEDGDLQMALKLARQATKEHPANPTLWNDLGLISQQNDALEEAERAFQSALSLAPEYAEAYANYAALSAQKGRLHQATRLLQRAAQLAPQLTSLQERLEQYKLLLPAREETQPSVEGPPPKRSLDLNNIDWEKIQEDLTRQGFSVLPKIIAPSECQDLIALYPQEEAFEKSVDLETEGDGKGEYKFLQRPLPEVVTALRSSLYERLAPIANHWNQLLQSKDRYPDTLEEFLQHCKKQGQDRTTPILLRYTAGGYNELHQDTWGKVFFPFQLAVTLSKRGDGGFMGGEFIVAEEASKKKSKPSLIELDQGDGVLFCTKHRLTKVGDMQALLTVKHGLAEVTSGERFCLGVPFHNYY